MRRRKLFAVILMSVAMSFMVQACGNSEGTGSAKESESSAETESAETVKQTESDEESTESPKETEESTGMESEPENEVSAEDEDLMVPGYSLGEIPAIVTPKIPDLTIIESPDAAFKVSAAEKLTSVPGITITPVVIKDGNIVNGNQVARWTETEAASIPTGTGFCRRTETVQVSTTTV